MFDGRQSLNDNILKKKKKEKHGENMRCLCIINDYCQPAKSFDALSSQYDTALLLWPEAIALRAALRFLPSPFTAL